MAYDQFKYSVASNTGTTTHTLPFYSSGLIMVTAVPISASGTLTITGAPEDSEDFQAITDGSIDLSAPEPILLNGRWNQLKFTASVGGDTYKIFITG